MADDVTCISGPVELIDGRLMLRIPLAEGGDALAGAARGIGAIVGENLDVTIPDWLARMLKIGDGSVVIVDNRGGKLNIHPDSGS